MVYNERVQLREDSFLSEKKTIVLEDLNADEASNLLGTQDRNLNVLAQSFGYTIYYRDNVFTIEDCPDEVAQKIEEVLHALLKQAERGISITEQDVIYASRAVQHNEPVDFEEFSKKIVGRLASGKAIMPKTRGQLAFVNAMEEKAIVFAVGPAGTGKTFLAVTAAVVSRREKTVTDDRNMNLPLLFHGLYPELEYRPSLTALWRKYTASIICVREKKPICSIRSPRSPATSPAVENSIARHICQGRTQTDSMVRAVKGNAVLNGMSIGRKYSTARSRKIITAVRVMWDRVAGVVFRIGVMWFKLYVCMLS